MLELSWTPLPSSYDGLADLVGHPHGLSLILEHVVTSAWREFDLWLLLIVFALEDFLPPGAIALLDLGSELRIISNEPSILHVLVHPLECIVIILDSH